MNKEYKDILDKYSENAKEKCICNICGYKFSKYIASQGCPQCFENELDMGEK